VGAGTGEGPYSLAIALDEAARQIGDLSYDVWATGVAGTDAAGAERGVYPLVFVEGLRPETLKRYFLRGAGLSAGLCTVKDALRERVTFVPGAALDTLPPTPPVDLLFVSVAAETFSIICRNPVGRALLGHLRPGGLLVVPAWPREELPLPGLRRIEDGIFARVPAARGAMRVA
jgi:chemotaxis methyl-accepting protein methylase